MALLFTILNGIFSSVFSATACGGANLAFSMLTDHGGKERKRHDLALEKLQRARDKWNEDRMKWLDFINKRYAKKMSREHTSTMLMRQSVSTIEHLKKKKLLPQVPELSDFYHPSEAQKNCELLFVTVGAGIATYALNKYFK